MKRLALFASIVACLAASALPAAAAAAAASPGVVMQTAETVARDALLETLRPALDARGATATIRVAAPDARRGAAPCTQLLGFVPPGARLVGKTVVGVRCVDGSTWQAFVAVDVRVDAPVWQTTRALYAGDVVGPADATLTMAALAPTDLDTTSAAGHSTASRAFATLDGRQPLPAGRTLLRPVGVGRALAVGDLREEGRVNANEAVRIVYVGDGFSVSSEGRTVTPADPGGNVQVRLSSGAVVAGTLRADRRVELPH